MTTAPSAPNALAMPAPMPLDAPVTMATFPESFMGMSFLNWMRETASLACLPKMVAPDAGPMPVILPFLPNLLKTGCSVTPV